MPGGALLRSELARYEAIRLITSTRSHTHSAEVTGALMSNDDARAAMNDAFARARVAGAGTPEANRIISQAMVSVGKKLPQTEVITVLKDYVPYADFSIVEAARTNGVWKRAAAKDTAELVSLLGLLSFKMTDHATDDQNVMNRETHAAAVRAYLPSALAMIKRSTNATDMDVFRGPLETRRAERAQEFRRADGERVHGMNHRGHLGFYAIFGGTVNGRGQVIDRHDLASATSFEAVVLAKLANSYVTYRDSWQTERDSTMLIGDALNDIARATGSEPAVALSVLKRTLTPSQFDAMQTLRAARRQAPLQRRHTASVNRPKTHTFSHSVRKGTVPGGHRIRRAEGT